MATQTLSFSPGTQILTPVQCPQDARMDAGDFAPSTTFTKGLSVGRKTADNLLYPLNTGASDGTQVWVAFCAISFKTDAAGLIYFVTGSDAAGFNGGLTAPASTAPIYFKGTFDPQDVTTKASPVAEVDTFTPASVTAGDVNTVTYTAPDLTTAVATFTVGGTATAAAVVTGLIAAWNANSTLAALGTASGTTTFIVTSNTPGNALSLASAVTGTGTLAKVASPAASGRAIADVQTGAPGARVLHNGYWEIP